MSAAQAHQKSGHEGRERAKRHPFRNALIVSLVIAAVILWQLNPILHGIHDVHAALLKAEGIRRTLAGLLSVGYHKVDAWISPLAHKVGK